MVSKIGLTLTGDSGIDMDVVIIDEYQRVREQVPISELVAEEFPNCG